MKLRERLQRLYYYTVPDTVTHVILFKTLLLGSKAKSKLNDRVVSKQKWSFFYVIYTFLSGYKPSGSTFKAGPSLNRLISKTNQRSSSEVPVDDTVTVQKIQIFYSLLFWPKSFHFMQLFLEIISAMANSVDPDQTAPRSSLIWVCTVCTCHFVRTFGVQIFRTLTV